MFSAHPLPDLLSQYTSELVAQLGRVRDGSEDAIHQARVAIRRVRETLSLGRTTAERAELATIDDRLDRAARALSRARDADVMQRLIHDVAARVLVAARPLAQLRAETMQEQVTLRRKAIKKLEALEVESLVQSIKGVRWQRPGWFRSRRAWSATLAGHMTSRAARVQKVTALAGGVYFPNRLHGARVAVKQLRYTFELADRTGVSRPRGGLGVLKRVQETLGDVHDRQVLLERLEDLGDDHSEWNRDEIGALQQFMHAEIRALHDRYVELRPEVLAVCDACIAMRRRSRTPTRALLAAGVVVPSVVLLRRRLSSDTPAQQARETRAPRSAKTA